MTLLGRRAILAQALAGTALVASPAKSTVWEPRALPAHKLQVGDMISGPSASVVRVQELHRFSTGRVRVRYTDPATGTTDALPLSPHWDKIGYSPKKPFVVYARAISVQAAKVAEAAVAAPPAAPRVIDGGKP